jgi:hypothetical protein
MKALTRTKMKRFPALLAATAGVFLTAVDTSAQAPPAAPSYSYADLADRALAAPVALTATITEAIRLEPERAPNLAPGHARLYVEADASALIRGPAGLPPRVRYLVDVPLGPKGKAPKLKKQSVLLLARPVPNRLGELQLVSRDAQMPLTPELEQRVRAILTEVVRRDAPPPVTGVVSAFHVPGAIPGEGETQIFLSTRDNRPISLNVLRRPGQDRQWSVALSEIVDEAAQPPARDTLLWYRLACGLPRSLPGEAVADLEPDAATAAREDYGFVLSQLGRCARNRPARG